MPGTTLRLRDGETANSECRAEDEKSPAPRKNPTLPLFTLSVLWRQYVMLYILTSLRQAFCYLEPKVFMTDTAVRPRIPTRKSDSRAQEPNPVPSCFTLPWALLALATPTPKFLKTTMFLPAPKPLLFPLPGGIPTYPSDLS